MNRQCDEFLQVMHDWKRVACKMKGNLISHGELFTLVNIAHMCDEQKGENKIEGVKVSELVMRMNTSKPGISKKLKYLEEKKFISRVIDSSDKRVMLIAPTEEGRRVMEHEKNEMDDFLENVLKRMGEEDTKEFLVLVRKLQGFMEEEIEIKNERMNQRND